MGTKLNVSERDCYVKAEPDEPAFTLLARDPAAADAVRAWAAGAADAGHEPEKIAGAQQLAMDMDAWRRGLTRRSFPSPARVRALCALGTLRAELAVLVSGAAQVRSPEEQVQWEAIAASLRLAVRVLESELVPEPLPTDLRLA